MTVHDLRSRLLRIVSRTWAAWRRRATRAPGGGPAMDLARDTRRAAARRRFWAELHEGRLEAEARCAK